MLYESRENAELEASFRMVPPPPPGSVILIDWYRSADSKEYFNRIKNKKQRRLFGLLEAPVLPPHLSVDIVRYKVFISGKSGVGKTALAARLAGLDIPNMHYETTGIETTVVFWPVKLRDNGQVLFFRLQLWDCGENALRRFDHLLPSCKEQVDAILFLFSFTDRASFEDLSNQIARSSEPSDNIVKLVVGTKFDLFMHTDVTDQDVRKFQEVWGLPVFRTGADVVGGFGEVGPLLNALAEGLWHQDCLAVGAARPSPVTGPGTETGSMTRT
ncbi:ciliogenesis and planar polarity effector 2 isoform X1 [Anguilla anguilla]|uniref:ciliogenesis and planar polarity effector 2 isoform X1 n=1 Tax=Anguilla anguilla TaxID=7936 RepID=UPI0015B2DB59|nr:ciliogenesis and planar polarity effector 2 isoform X1 [Anguilla anguilla]